MAQADSNIDKVTAALKERVMRDAHLVKGNPVIDAALIEDILAEVLAEGYRLGKASGIRKKREFRFDADTLRRKCREKKDLTGDTWMEISDAVGISTNALKQHLGETPPKTIAVDVVVSLMVYIQDFDVLGYLLEE